MEEFDSADSDSSEYVESSCGDLTNSICKKLRLGINAIRKSVLRREILRRQCEAFGLKCNDLKKDNSTRWNSTYKMLTRVMELRQAFDTTLISCKLDKLVLSEEEWGKIEEMITFLQPFQKMTLYLEQKGIPTMSLSVMIYIELYNHLESYSVEGHSAFLVKAANLACTKLNKYYPTSDGLVYVVGTVLDPRCKMAWYSSVKFEPAVVKGYKR